MSIASRIKGWFQPKNAEEQLLFDQTKFLLSQAPLMNLPTDVCRLQGSVIKYAYVNPITFAKVAKRQGYAGPADEDWGAQVSGSPTQWVFTPLLPEGTVIFSPNQMPGLAELEAELE